MRPLRRAAREGRGGKVVGLRGPVLTVGHSTRTSEEFARLLGENAVERVVDVRRFPGSRSNPRFNKDVLEGELGRARTGYTHLAGLGGRRRPRPDSPNAGWRNPSFRGYADHMATAEFRGDLERLLGLCEGSGRA